jgi:hypothetical protein
LRQSSDVFLADVFHLGREQEAVSVTVRK